MISCEIHFMIDYDSISGASKSMIVSTVPVKEPYLKIVIRSL